ncbi:hypothetical protein MIR68_011432 [Amoeboaphelidium protococcarum]|nr:hypothetical protein MIR68_011432 [Amoeboaphelidium protococcarum]
MMLIAVLPKHLTAIRVVVNANEDLCPCEYWSLDVSRKMLPPASNHQEPQEQTVIQEDVMVVSAGSVILL